jgi:hypothetical protein
MKAQSAVNRYLLQRPVAQLVESPGPIYLAGLGLGIVGCGALLVLLLGALSL